MNIAILTIGDELLNGDLADTNTATIARLLGEHDFSVRESACVGDQEEMIVNNLQRLAASYDIVIITGGLGPTEDDLTAKAAAKAFNRPLSLNDKALQQVRARFLAWRREMHPRNEKQALLPVRSAVIANQRGTAPGFQLQLDQADLFFLPGVPLEMQAMLTESVIPLLLEYCPKQERRVQRTLTVFGLAEPEVEARIIRSSLPEGVKPGFNVEFPFVAIKLRAIGPEADRLIDRAEMAVREALDDYIVGVGSATLAETTARLLKIAGLKIALAESCTGGLIAKMLTDCPGASEFLERGVVSYANSAKTALLNVAEAILEAHGAVSAECARAMASGIRQTAQTDIGLAVTGIAGPAGGSEEKPLGTIFMAMATGAGVRTEQFLFHGDRSQIRMRTACTALDWLRRLAMDRIANPSVESQE